MYWPRVYNAIIISTPGTNQCTRATLPCPKPKVSPQHSPPTLPAAPIPTLASDSANYQGLQGSKFIAAFAPHRPSWRRYVCPVSPLSCPETRILTVTDENEVISVLVMREYELRAIERAAERYLPGRCFHLIRILTLTRDGMSSVSSYGETTCATSSFASRGESCLTASF